MNEIIKYKRIVPKRDNITKILGSNTSNFNTMNGTQLFNDSNQRNCSSSLFTNEALIKSIANNTSPYNTFYPSTKAVAKNILKWEKKEHKRTVKNKLLLTNNTSINFNKSYLSRFTNSKINFGNKTNYIKSLKTKNNTNLIKQKLKKDLCTEVNEKILSNAQKDSNQAKEEMKLLKFKLNKILNENCLNICDTFEQRNDKFNIKLRNYFDSDRYIEGKKIEHGNLNQNKKGFSSSHNLLNYYYEPTVDKRTNEELMACSIMNNLSNEEQNIVSLNPKYFLIDKKKVLINKLNIVLNESLKDKLNREEKVNNKNAFTKEENKTEINNDIKKIFNKKLSKKTKIYNEKKINNKMIEYHHKSLIKEISKNRVTEYVNSGIKDYYKRFYSFCHKNDIKFNQYKKGDYDYKMFNYPLNYKMTKEYFLIRNDKRLQREKNFHNDIKRNNRKKQSLIDKIKSYQDIIKINYNKQ
mgnify:FL=1